jgi:hypothetical protein
MVAESAALVPVRATLVPYDTFWCRRRDSSERRSTFSTCQSNFGARHIIVVAESATLVPVRATFVPYEVIFGTRRATLMRNRAMLVPVRTTLVPDDAIFGNLQSNFEP